MENWDEEKLKEVVEKKHGEREKKLPPTDIICKHFLEGELILENFNLINYLIWYLYVLAVETNKYGWFWECPNGGEKCHYRHALPPGFVLKKDRKNKDKKEDITIEELVEIERSKLTYNLTKITLETFLAWKKRKIMEKQAKEKKDIDRKKAEFKAGKNLGLSGREMFTFNPELARDNEMDEGEATFDIVRENDENDEAVDVKEIDIDSIMNEARESDQSGTQCAEMNRNFTTSSDNKTEPDTGIQPSSATNGDSGGNEDEDIINEPIDETLFADDDGLDGLDDELESATISWTISNLHRSVASRLQLELMKTCSFNNIDLTIYILFLFLQRLPLSYHWCSNLSSSSNC